MTSILRPLEEVAIAAGGVAVVGSLHRVDVLVHNSGRSIVPKSLSPMSPRPGTM